MSFKAPEIPSPAVSLPAPPPTPPMFGSQAQKAKPTQQPSMAFTSSVIGSTPQQQAQKSLLGQ